MSRCRREQTFQELTSWCSCRFQLTGRQDNEVSCDEAVPFPCSHKTRFFPVLSAAKSSPSRNHAPVDGARLCRSSFSRGEESWYSSHLHILSIPADASAEREQASARGDRILLLSSATAAMWWRRVVCRLSRMPRLLITASQVAEVLRLSSSESRSMNTGRRVYEANDVP